ncbi:MAG: hypothetical protein RLZZ385_50 [Pseudomonadota bacterium]|jgi:HD-like signal output (HDOD) protein
MSDMQEQALDAATVNRLFNQNLFGHEPDSLVGLNEFEQLLYHKVCATVEQQDKLAKFMPSPPTGIIGLLKELDSADTNFTRIKDIAKEDPNIVGEIIRVSNSPLYLTRSGEITSLEKAIVLLGINGVAKVASLVMMRDTVNLESSRYRSQMRRLWSHCLNSAEACQLLGDGKQGFENFILGLIHDIGSVTVFSLVSHFVDASPGVAGDDLKVLQRVVAERATWLSTLVAGEWGLPSHYLLILNDYDRLLSDELDEDSLTLCEPQTRLLWLGSLCAKVYTLLRKQLVSRQAALVFLSHSGLDEPTADKLFTRLDLANASY